MQTHDKTIVINILLLFTTEPYPDKEKYAAGDNAYTLLRHTNEIEYQHQHYADANHSKNAFGSGGDFHYTQIMWLLGKRESICQVVHLLDVAYQVLYTCAYGHIPPQ